MLTTDYLDALKAARHLETDYQLAKLLDCSTAQLSQYRQRKRVMDDYTAARVAEMLGVDPLKVIAQANAEREKTDTKRAFWQKLAACVVCSVGVSFSMTNDARALDKSSAYAPQADNLQIMLVIDLFKRPAATTLDSNSHDWG